MKKPFIQLLYCVFVMMLGFSRLAGAAELVIRLEDPPETGIVAFALFDSANAFGDLRDPVMVVSFPLDGRVEYVVADVPAGEYALSSGGALRQRKRRTGSHTRSMIHSALKQA